MSIHCRSFFSIAVPPHLIRPATRKKRSPLLIAEANKKGKKETLDQLVKELQKILNESLDKPMFEL